MITITLTLEEAEALSHYTTVGLQEYGEDEAASRAVHKLDEAIKAQTKTEEVP